MTTLTLVRGLPGSGKTTWSKNWVAENPKSRARVNRDDIRMQTVGMRYGLSRAEEETVTVIERAMVEALVRSGKNVVVDAMHARSRYITEWYKFARSLGVPDVKIAPFPTSKEELIKRNSSRPQEERIPEDALNHILSRFDPECLPMVDTYQEFLKNNSHSGDVYVPDESKPPVFIVDIDGTLAHNTSGRGWYDWSRVGEDSPDLTLMSVIRSIQSSGTGHIICMSGRSEECRKQTQDWLATHDIHPLALIMRRAGDHRKDAIVKLELFNKFIRDNYNVKAWFDDRPSVCRMVRTLGIPLYQVGDPYIDF